MERLHIEDKSFWKKFNFIMPRIGYDNTKPAIITDSSREKKIVKLPKLASHMHSIHPNPGRDSNASEKRSRHLNNIKNNLQAKKEEYDGSQTSLKKERISKDAHLSYASNYKSSKNLRHIIVPIPDFMRTQLGYGNTKSVGIGDESVETDVKSSLSSSAVAPEKVMLDSKPNKKTTSGSAHLLPPLMISHQNNTIEPTMLDESRAKSSNNYNHHLNSQHYNNNKISIINENVDMIMPSQTNTLVKNFLPSEREAIRMSVNARNAIGNRSLMNRSESPEILDMFKPKSAQKKMRISVEEEKL
jgi:hypothetical protein